MRSCVRARFCSALPLLILLGLVDALDGLGLFLRFLEGGDFLATERVGRRRHERELPADLGQQECGVVGERHPQASILNVARDAHQPYGVGPGTVQVEARAARDACAIFVEGDVRCLGGKRRKLARGCMLGRGVIALSHVGHLL